jgi:hypothetical protein
MWYELVTLLVVRELLSRTLSLNCLQYLSRNKSAHSKPQTLIAEAIKSDTTTRFNEQTMPPPRVPSTRAQTCETSDMPQAVYIIIIFVGVSELIVIKWSYHTGQTLELCRNTVLSSDWKKKEQMFDLVLTGWEGEQMFVLLERKGWGLWNDVSEDDVWRERLVNHESESFCGLVGRVWLCQAVCAQVLGRAFWVQCIKLGDWVCKNKN